MSQVIIIFPHQLFEQSELLKTNHPIYLVEDPRFFTDFNFHKQKLIFHRATMQEYYQWLKKKKHTVHYVELNKSPKLLDELKKKKIKTVHLYELADVVLEKRIKTQAKQKKIELVLHASPLFLTPDAELKKFFVKKKKQYRMNSFYIEQRKRMGILISNGEPVGGQWSFDQENRTAPPQNLKVPKISFGKPTASVKQATAYVEKKFSENPGTVKPFIYPVTFAEAKKWLAQFIKKRLKEFGPYQDAIIPDEPFMFHSVLSPLLNCGLLTPEYVLDQVLKNKKTIPLNSLEGFVRQLIGWREFMWGAYNYLGAQQRKSNFFNHRKKVPRSFWQATTGIAPVDNAIEEVLEYAYAHHIQRLMILGNIMLLLQIKPDAIYQWFMELFIDAYDWVMVPNVYSMSQYADGGLITTKPYISSSNYILKMSTFKKGDWCDMWDALFWLFIKKNKKKLTKIPRMKFMIALLDKKTASEMNGYVKTVKKWGLK